MVNAVPLIGFGLFVGVGFVWRSWLQRRRFGTTGFALFQSGRWVQHVREALMVALSVALGAQAIAAARGSAWVDALRLLPESGAALAAGASLMLAGTVLMAAAQLDLGVAWRIGIEEAARPGLVVDGLYRFSRNPIFAAMFVALFGYLVALPTALSVLALAAAIIGVWRQVREEEAYLLRAYGAAYAVYAARVGRFVPGLGRLRAAR